MERKVKYDCAFKLECVKLVLEKHFSNNCICSLQGLNEVNIRKWINFYDKYGSDGLFSRKNQSYWTIFELKVLEAITKELLELSGASVKFNMPHAAIIVQWKRDFANFGLKVLTIKPRIRLIVLERIKRKSDKPLTRKEEFLKKIKALYCENELLKKLQKFIQLEDIAKSTNHNGIKA